MQVSYRIVQTINHMMVASTPTDILAWAEVNNRKVIGISRSKVLRNELLGQPIISGLCGPMYDGHQDGVPVIRYEDQASYNLLSN
jgi:hypothetical protein